MIRGEDVTDTFGDGGGGATRGRRVVIVVGKDRSTVQGGVSEKRHFRYMDRLTVLREVQVDKLFTRHVCVHGRPVAANA